MDSAVSFITEHEGVNLRT